MGRRVLPTGDLGSASIFKVMTNYLATANLLTLCEALVTMKAAGLNLATTHEAIKTRLENLVCMRSKATYSVGISGCEFYHGFGA